MLRALSLLLAMSSSAFAQDSDVPSGDIRVVGAKAAMLRGLDKVSGEVVDFDLTLDESFTVGSIEVFLRECRHPEDNMSGEAFAWLDIADPGREQELFSGWMIASSPALNALDHPRYDVWVIRCTTT